MARIPSHTSKPPLFHPKEQPSEEKGLHKERSIKPVEANRFISRKQNQGLLRKPLADRTISFDHQANSEINTANAKQTTTNEPANQHQRTARAHKILKQATLNDSNSRLVLCSLIMARAQSKDIPSIHENNALFTQEAIDALLEMDDRGLSLGHPSLSTTNLAKHQKHIKDLAINYEAIAQADEILKAFIESDTCPKWDNTQRLLRGGHQYFESKLARNLQKDKPAYKPSSINIGPQAYGSGLYVTTDVKLAEHAMNKDAPGLANIQLKDNVPVIDTIENETVKQLLATITLEDDAPLNATYYLEKLCPLPVLLKHYDDGDGCTIFTIKSPKTIASVEMYDHQEKRRKTSIQRLDETQNTIKGNPSTFQEFLIPENARVAQPRRSILTTVKGGEGIANQPVYTCVFPDRSVQHFIKSPLDPSINWAVSPTPNKPNEFIINPDSSFLKARHTEKLENTVDSMEAEMQPILQTLRKKMKSLEDLGFLYSKDNPNPF